MSLRIWSYGPRGRKGLVAVVRKTVFEVRVDVVPDVTRDTVPELDPATAVPVEIVNRVTSVVSVTRVVSVETQVVLTVTGSLMMDTEVGWWDGETGRSLASFAGPSLRQQ